MIESMSPEIHRLIPRSPAQECGGCHGTGLVLAGLPTVDGRVPCRVCPVCRGRAFNVYASVWSPPAVVDRQTPEGEPL